MHAQTPPSTDQFIRLINIIAVALVTSVLVYMVIAWVVAPTVAEAGGAAELIQMMAAILTIVSLGHLVAAQMLFAIRVRAAEKLPTPEQRLSSYRVAIILSFALREAVAVYGLILSFLSGDVRWASALAPSPQYRCSWAGPGDRPWKRSDPRCRRSAEHDLTNGAG